VKGMRGAVLLFRSIVPQGFGAKKYDCQPQIAVPIKRNKPGTFGSVSQGIHTSSTRMPQAAPASEMLEESDEERCNCEDGGN
jgi:hypothetical protein